MGVSTGTSGFPPDLSAHSQAGSRAVSPIYLTCSLHHSRCPQTSPTVTSEGSFSFLPSPVSLFFPYIILCVSSPHLLCCHDQHCPSYLKLQPGLLSQPRTHPSMLCLVTLELGLCTRFSFARDFPSGSADVSSRVRLEGWGPAGGGDLLLPLGFAVSLSVILLMALTLQQRLVAASNWVLCFCTSGPASETPASAGSVPFSEICGSAPSTLLRFEVLTTCPLPSHPAALG